MTPQQREHLSERLGKPPSEISLSEIDAEELRLIGFLGRLRRFITPVIWATRLSAVITHAWPFDWTDVMYFAATALVGFGCSRSFGLGYGHIAGGLMLSLPLFLVFIAKFRGPKK